MRIELTKRSFLLKVESRCKLELVVVNAVEHAVSVEPDVSHPQGC